MITEFTNRRPVLSTVLVVLLFFLVPGAFMVGASIATGGASSGTGVIFIYALILQFILWLKVERPILIVLPFILSLIGLVVSEIVYAVGRSVFSVGLGPGPYIHLFVSGAVGLTGHVAAASVGGLILYSLVVIFRKVREVITER